MDESVLSYIPATQEKQPYHLQASLTLPEATLMEKFLLDESLPFGGDKTTLVRTFLRYAMAHLSHETGRDDSFVTSLTPMLNTAFLRWTTESCDAFAASATDHMLLALHAGDTSNSSEVVQQIAEILENVKHPSALLMLKKALTRRGFVAGLTTLHQAILDEGGNVYWLDNLMSEVFA